MSFDLYARFHGDSERGNGSNGALVDRDRAIEERALRLFAAGGGDWLAAVAEAARQIEGEARGQTDGRDWVPRGAPGKRSRTMSRPAGRGTAPPPGVYRKARGHLGLVDEDEVARYLDEAQADAGAQLPRPLRDELAGVFGVDLDSLAQIRVHDGAAADAAAVAVAAEAFTVGRDIHFAAGAYQPGSAAGRHLIAHEVAHALGQPDEHAADAFADAFVRGDRAGGAAAVPAARTPDAAVKRKAKKQANKRKKQAAAKQAHVAQERELVFDGRRLSWHGADGRPHSVAAVSGLKRGNKTLAELHRRGVVDELRDYTDPQFQDLNGVGPIQAGDYVLALAPGVPKQKSGGGWGLAAWRLVPASAGGRLREIVGAHVDIDGWRGGFFLHQDGGNDGTAGCIGVSTAADTMRVWQFLKARQRDGQTQIKVRVRYDGGGGAARPPALDAETTRTYFNLRESPGDGAVLGKLSGASTPIVVEDKTLVGKTVWYRVRLKAPVGKLAAGTTGWLTDAAVKATVPWKLFREQLHAWEAEPAHAALDVGQRITRLRQMCHERSLPIDSFVGVPEGDEYLDERAYTGGVWQLLKDAQAVRMPDGRVVDMFHLFAGLDALPAERRVENQTYLGVEAGQSYAAATWSGDLGAAAAEAHLGLSEEWEAAVPAGTSEEQRRRLRLDHYYATRAAERDLLGDLDAWAVDDLRGKPGIDSVEALLAGSYATSKAVRRTRARAFERFLAHYGFAPDAPLVQQPARAAMVQQVTTFARAWVVSKAGKRKRAAAGALFGGADPDMVTHYVEPMTDRFLIWLDAQRRMVK